MIPIIVSSPLLNPNAANPYWTGADTGAMYRSSLYARARQIKDQQPIGDRFAIWLDRMQNRAEQVPAEVIEYRVATCFVAAVLAMVVFALV